MATTSQPGNRLSLRPRRWPWAVGLAVVAVVAALLGWPRREAGLPLVAQLTTPGSSSQYFVPWPLAFSPDGAMLAASLPGEGVAFWEWPRASIRATSVLRAYLVGAVYDRTGTRLAVQSVTLGANSVSSVAILAAAGGKERAAFEVGGPVVSNVAFSDDGVALGLIERDLKKSPTFQTRSWDAESGEPLSNRPVPLPPQVPPQGLVAFSSDGSIAVAADRMKRGATVWDIGRGKAVGELLAPGSTPSTPVVIEISSDGSTGVVGQSDGTLEIWDIPTLTLRTTLRGHSPDKRPFRVLFSPDPNVLISEATEQGMNRLTQKLYYVVSWVMTRGRSQGTPPETVVWDLKTGQVRARLVGECRAVVSWDGKWLATASEDRIIRVRELSPR